jgi:hypothetical protein
MNISLLKLIRLVVPIFLAFLYAKLLGFVTGLWTTILPDLEKAQYLPIVVVPAALYYITPFRSWINAPNHKRITERLRNGLVQITGYVDRKDRYTWGKLQPLFYDLVNQDEGLKHKSTLAFINGALWSSFADSTVLAILFFLASMVLYWIGFNDAFLAGMLFLLITAVSLAGSLVCTNRQIGIGADQLAIIEFKYKSDVEKRLNNLDG